MKKKTMYKIIILILFTFILPIVKIPPQDIEGWKYYKQNNIHHRKKTLGTMISPNGTLPTNTTTEIF